MLPETIDLFPGDRARVALSPGAVLLGGFATPVAAELLAAIDAIAAAAPFRHLETPGGRRMSVAMSNAGDLGWTSDRRGYRYTRSDPTSGMPWPPMPTLLLDTAKAAASLAGFPGFEPEACLVNRYEPGSRLSLHQDRDERNLDQPIVSISLGASAIFLWGGRARGDRVRRIPLLHGDVVVWGGPARLTYHGVQTIDDQGHSLTGALRFNLTFRRAE